MDDRVRYGVLMFAQQVFVDPQAQFVISTRLQDAAFGPGLAFLDVILHTSSFWRDSGIVTLMFYMACDNLRPRADAQ